MGGDHKTIVCSCFCGSNVGERGGIDWIFDCSGIVLHKIYRRFRSKDQNSIFYNPGSLQGAIMNDVIIGIQDNFDNQYNFFSILIMPLHLSQNTVLGRIKAWKSFFNASRQPWIENWGWVQGSISTTCLRTAFNCANDVALNFNFTNKTMPHFTKMLN